jgi:hypothetical protein
MSEEKGPPDPGKLAGLQLNKESPRQVSTAVDRAWIITDNRVAKWLAL